MNKKRLLKVAQALRESPNPRKFTMERFGNDCGTPACALGHYAARRDLQRSFRLGVNKAEHCGAISYYDNLVETKDGYVIGFDSDSVLTHFGISIDQAFDLFAGEDGCGGAKTALQAAKFIERFVASAD